MLRLGEHQGYYSGITSHRVRLTELCAAEEESLHLQPTYAWEQLGSKLVQNNVILPKRGGYQTSPVAHFQYFDQKEEKSCCLSLGDWIT